MPGSLSNEDEGQDDVDFGDDLPGELKGRRGVLHTVLRCCALNAAKRARPAFPRAQRRRRRVGCKKHSHASFFIYFCGTTASLRWERALDLAVIA